jgi:hypothetical protein
MNTSTEEEVYEVIEGELEVTIDDKLQEQPWLPPAVPTATSRTRPLRSRCPVHCRPGQRHADDGYIELSMNRAAEQAAPAAKQIFINAITR